MPQTVWIVCHDESPHNTVLGVFHTRDEAQTMADEVGSRFESGVICFSWIVGQRYDEGTRYAALHAPS